MDFEAELNRLADTYAKQGYQVTIHPDQQSLPPFAMGFEIEILCKRGTGGVLVAVKKDRDEVAADSSLTRYAELINAQEGWRFDLAIVEVETPNPREIDWAEDFSEKEIEKSFADAVEMMGLGFLRPAVITAWAGFEAAMRLRLRAAGERAGWGSAPRAMLNEIYSNGMINIVEFRELEALSRVRNQIAHGFTSHTPEKEAVRILCEIGSRLLEEAREAKLPA
jgi:hypothetical protein